MDERFSAFIDNEASVDETDAVIHRLLRDPAQRALWSRQHWLRTTLRASPQDSAAPLDANFADRVMTALAAGEYGDDAADSPAPVMAPPASRVKWRWRAAVSTLAVASLAGVVVLASRPFTSSTDGATSTAQPRQASVSEALSGDKLTSFSTVSLPNDTSGRQAVSEPQTVFATAKSSGGGSDRRGAQPSNKRWTSVSSPALRKELNSYVVEHNGLAQGYGLSTSPSLVHAVTYGSSTAQ